MSTLPEGLDPKKLLSTRWPPDATILDARLHAQRMMRRTPEVANLFKAKGKQMFVHFRDGDRQDYPDAMTLGELRAKVDAGAVLHIEIDDDEGGVRKRVPERVI